MSEKNWTENSERHGFLVKYKIKNVLFSSKSNFQKIDIYDLEKFGKMLFLDNDLNICESDSLIYDKAMVDPVFEINPDTKKIMIIGGGDGGVLREALCHEIEEAIMIEIDKIVIDACKKHMPSVSENAFDDKRSKLIIGDATKIIKEYKDLDAVISDLTDPEIIAKEFGKEFYENLFLDIKNSLKEGGVLSLQVGSYYEKNMIMFLEQMLKKYFKRVEFRQVFIPSYVEPWIFGYAIK